MMSKEASGGRLNKAARELGCDDNEERFQEALRKAAKRKSPHSQPPKSKT
jgi:hypothetical protein